MRFHARKLPDFHEKLGNFLMEIRQLLWGNYGNPNSKSSFFTISLTPVHLSLHDLLRVSSLMFPQKQKNEATTG